MVDRLTAENELTKADTARRKQWRLENEDYTAPTVQKNFCEQATEEMLVKSRAAAAHLTRAAPAADWTVIDARITEHVMQACDAVADAGGELTGEVESRLRKRLDKLETEVTLLRQLLTGQIATLNSGKGKQLHASVG